MHPTYIEEVTNFLMTHPRATSKEVGVAVYRNVAPWSVQNKKYQFSSGHLRRWANEVLQFMKSKRGKAAVRQDGKLWSLS